MTDPPETDPLPEAPAATVGSGMRSPMSRLARRLAARTSDLIAIAIVSAGLLTVSGRLGDWWATSPDDVLSSQQLSQAVSGGQMIWGDGESPVTLLSSELPVSMQRQIVNGDQDRADAVLIAHCRKLLDGADSTIASAEDEFQRTASRLLTELKNESPIEAQPGDWKLYRLDSKRNFIPGSVFVGVALQPAPHVVCWAMAIPHGDAVWTTFVFSPANTHSIAVSRLTLPSGARRVFSVTSSTGDELAVLSFDGESLEQTIEQLNEHFTEAGWQVARGWTQSPTGWTARFEHGPEPRDDRLAAGNDSAGNDSVGNGFVGSSLALELALQTSSGNKPSGIANVIVTLPRPAPDLKDSAP